MSYVPGTILRRKEPFKQSKGEDPDFTPYNEVKVICASPVQVVGRTAEWHGQAGEDMTIAPTSFGGVVDRPLGELERDYEVVSIPDPDATLATQQTATRYVPGPSPEEKFKKDALANAAV